MTSTNTARNKFNHLRVPPGPKPGWQARAATDLGYTPSYVSRLARGMAASPAAQAALADWKKKNKISA